MDSSEVQLLIDSGLSIRLEQHQVDLICLSILHGSLLTNRGLPKTELFERAEEVMALYQAICGQRLASELFGGGK
jgi:hypothetical protein